MVWFIYKFKGPPLRGYLYLRYTTILHILQAQHKGSPPSTVYYNTTNTPSRRLFRCTTQNAITLHTSYSTVCIPPSRDPLSGGTTQDAMLRSFGQDVTRHKPTKRATESTDTPTGEPSLQAPPQAHHAPEIQPCAHRSRPYASTALSHLVRTLQPHTV